MPKEKPEPAPEYTATSLACTPIQKLLDERAQLVASIKESEEQAEVLGLRIRGLLEKHKLEKVRVGRWQPCIILAHKPKRLDAIKLLELGVKQSLISKATVGGEEYKQFRVMDLGEQEER